MRLNLVIMGLMLLFVSPMTKAWAVDLKEPEKAPSGKQEMQDRSKEDACDCCQKCKAARRPIESKEEEGAAETNGCKDCCDKCGRVMHPDPKEAPPEIIEHRIPDEIKDPHTLQKMKEKSNLQEKMDKGTLPEMKDK
jgi:hypothetical protein